MESIKAGLLPDSLIFSVFSIKQPQFNQKFLFELQVSVKRTQIFLYNKGFNEGIQQELIKKIRQSCTKTEAVIQCKSEQQCNGDK